MTEQTAAVVIPDIGDPSDDNTSITTSGSSKKNTESRNPLSKIAKTTANYGNTLKTGTSKMQQMRESGGGAVDSLSRNTGKMFKNVTSPIKSVTTAVTGGVKIRVSRAKQSTSSIDSCNSSISSSTANRIHEKPSTISRRSTTEDLEEVTLKSYGSMESNDFPNDTYGGAEEKPPLPLEDETINMKEKVSDSDTEKKIANAPFQLPIDSSTFTKKIKSAAKGTGKMVKTATAPVKGGIQKIGKAVPVVQEKVKRTAKTVVDKGIKAPVTAVVAPIVKQISRSSEDSTVSTKDEDENIDIREDDDRDIIAKVAPDEVLKNMTVIIKKRLTGISIQDFYNICWSEGCTTGAPPLYYPWLVASGKEDIEVQDWTCAKENDEFVGSWDGETYPQKRMVTFKFNRTGPLLGGPPVANVEHTQYCRVEGNDICVLATTVRMQGIPFADTFTVEIRWVARRVGLANIQIEVGLFVNFSKTPFVAGQIRGGTITETTKTQLDLFSHVKGACNQFRGEDLDEENASVADLYDDDNTNGPETCSVCFGGFLSKLFKPKPHLDECSIP